jgi:Putative transmembrane protein (PGPGW)
VDEVETPIRWTGPWRALPAWLRRVTVGLVGGGLVAAGVALLVLPGPGLVVIGLGLGLLATEFAWARRLTRQTFAWLAAARRRWRGDSAGDERH